MKKKLILFCTLLMLTQQTFSMQAWFQPYIDTVTYYAKQVYSGLSNNLTKAKIALGLGGAVACWGAYCWLKKQPTISTEEDDDNTPLPDSKNTSQPTPQEPHEPRQPTQSSQTQPLGDKQFAELQDKFLKNGNAEMLVISFKSVNSRERKYKFYLKNNKQITFHEFQDGPGNPIAHWLDGLSQQKNQRIFHIRQKDFNQILSFSNGDMLNPNKKFTLSFSSTNSPNKLEITDSAHNDNQEVNAYLLKLPTAKGIAIWLQYHKNLLNSNRKKMKAELKIQYMYEPTTIRRVSNTGVHEQLLSNANLELALFNTLKTMYVKNKKTNEIYRYILKDTLTVNARNNPRASVYSYSAGYPVDDIIPNMPQSKNQNYAFALTLTPNANSFEILQNDQSKHKIDNISPENAQALKIWMEYCKQYPETYTAQFIINDETAKE